MNDRDYELLSRHLDGLLGPSEDTAFSQAMLDDPELNATHQAWKEIDMAARDAYPRTSFSRPALPAQRRPLWLRAAIAALIALTLGGLTWAAFEFFGGEKPGDAQQDVAPQPIQPGPADASGVDQTDQPDPSDRTFGQPTAMEVGAQEALVRGRVIDAQNNPIAGADITSYWREVTPSQDRARADTVSSDENGQFELPGSLAVDQCLIYKAGYMPVVMVLDHGLANAHTYLVRLHRTASAVGLVVDTAGRPISGATLHSTVTLFFRDAVSPFTTQGDGTLEAPLARGSEALWGQFDNFAWFELGALSPEIVLTADLRPGAAVRVRVMRNGDPVSNALVSVDSSIPIPLNKRTDLDGFATFSNLQANAACTVWATDRYGYTAQQELLADEMASGAPNSCLIELPALGRSVLQGAVSSPEGESVPAIAVYALQEEQERQFVAISDDRGRYRLPLQTGRYRIIVSLLADHHLSYDRSKGAEISVPDGTAEVTLDLTLDRKTVTMIPVRDNSGAPIKRVAFCQSPRGGWSAVSLVDLPQGSLSVRNSERAFHVLDPDTGMAGVWPGTISKPHSSRVTLTIPTGAVAGIAVDPDGAPLPNLVIRAEIRSRNLPNTNSWPTVYGETDASGRFVLEPVPNVGEVVATIHVSGYQALDNMEERPVVPGNAPEFLRIAFGPKNARVAGHLVYADQTPAEDFTVTAHSGGATWAYERSGVDGEFELYVAAGAYRLHAGASGATATAVLDVSAPAQDVEWVLPVPSPKQMAEVTEPAGPEHRATAEGLAALSELFMEFASDAEGGRYPSLIHRYGVFLPDFSQVREATGVSGGDMADLLGQFAGDLCYLGYLTPDELTGMAFLDAYEAYGPDGIAGEDINMSEEAQQEGLPRLFQIREGIERFVITDINDPNGAGKARSTIPVMWEMPGAHEESGGWVVYMDGHTEWLPYPGPFPMSEAFVERVREIGGVTQP